MPRVNYCACGTPAVQIGTQWYCRDCDLYLSEKTLYLLEPERRKGFSGPDEKMRYVRRTLRRVLEPEIEYLEKIGYRATISVAIMDLKGHVIAMMTLPQHTD